MAAVSTLRRLARRIAKNCAQIAAEMKEREGTEFLDNAVFKSLIGAVYIGPLSPISEISGTFSESKITAGVGAIAPEEVRTPKVRTVPPRRFPKLLSGNQPIRASPVKDLSVGLFIPAVRDDPMFLRLEESVQLAWGILHFA